MVSWAQRDMSMKCVDVERISVRREVESQISL